MRWFAALRAMCSICGNSAGYFYRLAWFDTVEFNCLPSPNNEMYDDAVFADRFRYQFNMFGIRILIWLSRFLHAHIAFEIDTANIITVFFLISYWLHDLIRINSIVCHVQRTWWKMIRFTLIDSAINWLCLEFEYW